MFKTRTMRIGLFILAGWIVPAVVADDRALIQPWLVDLQEDLPAVRRQAVIRLGQLGDRTAVPPLIQSLQDLDSSVRAESARALGQLKDHRAVASLIQALDDDDANVRHYAAYALGELRAPQAIDALLTRLADPQWAVRDQAAWALRRQLDPPLGRRLATLLSQQDKDVRAVLWLLHQLEPEHTLEIFTDLLTATELPVRLLAVRELASVDDSGRWAPLLQLLGDDQPVVRRAAIEALAESEQPSMRAVFRQRLATEDDPDAAQLLRQAIDRLSPARHLAAWWSFDDRSTKIARDMTGGGSDGRILGCQVVDGRIGAALRFGPGHYIELGQPPNLPIANRPFTVMAWARSEADEGVVVARGGAACGFSLYIKDSVARFGIQRLADQPGFLAIGTQPVVGDWVHLAGVVHEDRIELFVDGRLAATTPTDGFIPGNCGQGMEIGFDLANSPAEITTPFRGILDEVKFFHAALSAEDIREVKE
ncbi:MAG: hypothetical protein EA424_27055 [Planctomycetaceae bacterium]|nr:MAG: hypothetical protein EA424_27055 [Planctomycetaceae bacterium]